MFTIFQRRDKPFEKEAAELYNAAVTQSRHPVFYEKMGVPDTLDGRFEMICLHVAFVIHRLNEDFERSKELSQALFDVMFADMDQSLREIGIGDMGIPRRMKHMMKSLNGRMHVYDPAQDIADALRRNVFGTVKDLSEEDLKAMSTYTQDLRAKLDSQPLDMLMSGKIEFEGLLNE